MIVLYYSLTMHIEKLSLFSWIRCGENGEDEASSLRLQIRRFDQPFRKLRTYATVIGVLLPVSTTVFLMRRALIKSRLHLHSAMKPARPDMEVKALVTNLHRAVDWSRTPGLRSRFSRKRWRATGLVFTRISNFLCSDIWSSASGVVLFVLELLVFETLRYESWAI